MTVNWSSQRVVVDVVVVVWGLFTLMAGSNDDNDICIVNVPLQQQRPGKHATGYTMVLFFCLLG